MLPSHSNKTSRVVAQKHIDQWNRRSVYKPTELQPCDLDKGAKNRHWRKTISSTNGVGKTEYLHVED
jgi:hypothetical protein